MTDGGTSVVGRAARGTRAMVVSTTGTIPEVEESVSMVKNSKDCCYYWLCE